MQEDTHGEEEGSRRGRVVLPVHVDGALELGAFVLAIALLGEGVTALGLEDLEAVSIACSTVECCWFRVRLVEHIRSQSARESLPQNQQPLRLMPSTYSVAGVGVGKTLLLVAHASGGDIAVNILRGGSRITNSGILSAAALGGLVSGTGGENLLGGGDGLPNLCGGIVRSLLDLLGDGGRGGLDALGSGLGLGDRVLHGLGGVVGIVLGVGGGRAGVEEVRSLGVLAGYMWHVGAGAYGGDGEGNGADDPGDVGRGRLGGGVSRGTAERSGAGDVAGRDFGDTGGAESCAGEHRVGCFFL